MTNPRCFLIDVSISQKHTEGPHMRWLRIAGIFGALVGGIAMLSSCASMHQKKSEVYRREAGGRLEPWKTVGEASETLP
jgi:hypothetical protein